MYKIVHELELEDKDISLTLNTRLLFVYVMYGGDIHLHISVLRPVIVLSLR
jgi:hypothetical protein